MATSLLTLGSTFDCVWELRAHLRRTFFEASKGATLGGGDWQDRRTSENSPIRPGSTTLPPEKANINTRNDPKTSQRQRAKRFAEIQMEGATMNPLTPKTESQPSTLRKAEIRRSLNAGLGDLAVRALVVSAVLLSSPAFAVNYFMTPSGVGTAANEADGLNWTSAFSPSEMSAVLNIRMHLPGDVLHLGSGTNIQAFFSVEIPLQSSGLSSNPKRIVGEDTGGGFPVIDRGPWSRTSTAGHIGIGFSNGASYWAIENLVIQNVKFGVTIRQDLATGQYVGITLRNLSIFNSMHPIYIWDAKDWLIENIVAARYKKHGFRFDNNCQNITNRNCTADLSGGDTSWYANNIAEGDPMGFLVDRPSAGAETGPASSNIVFENCLAQHHRRDGQTGCYWQGDGFVINEENTGVFVFTGCRALDNEDGGFDIKPAARLTDCVAFRNFRNYRFHLKNDVDSSLNNCVSGYPINRGTTCGGPGGVWAQDSIVLLDLSTIHGDSGTAVIEEGSGKISLTNSILSFEGDAGLFTNTNNPPVLIVFADDTVTYRPGAGIDPNYVNANPAWNGLGNAMDSQMYTTKGYFFFPPEQDFDADGSNNRQEQLAGTDRRNPASVFRITAVGWNGAGNFDVSFTSIVGKRYYLERTDDFGAGIWSMASNQISGTGNVVVVRDPDGSGARRFYRVSVVVP